MCFLESKREIIPPVNPGIVRLSIPAHTPMRLPFSGAASVPGVIRHGADLGPNTLPGAGPLGSVVGQQEESRGEQGRRI